MKIIGRIFLSLIALLLLAWILIQTEPVQNFIIRKVTAQLSKDLKTEVSIRHVSFTLFNRMNLDNTLIRDQNKDTLLFAGALKVRITDWFFLKKNIELNYIGLENAVIYQTRKDSVWNYQFLIDHFSSTKKDTAKSNLSLNLKKLDFQNVRYVQNDLWAGTRMTVALGGLLMDADTVDLKTLNLKIGLLEVDKPSIAIEYFKGLKPLEKAAIVAPEKKDTGLYFNSMGMLARVDSLQIIDGSFALMPRGSHYKPVPFFDADDIQIRHVNVSAGKLLFDKDTITSNIRLSAAERSGIEVKNLTAAFKLTPRIMEFSRLDLRTANSHVQNYFAMRFKNFAEDMNYFNEKVTLDARLNSSSVSSTDIAFFAPALKSWKKQWAVSGNMSGSISNFKVDKIFVRDQEGMQVSGNLAMRGLPDIDVTLIDIENLNATTTYKQLLPIVPQLKTLTNPDLSAMGTVNYTGFYKGTIHNFTTVGNLKSVLGGASLNLALKVPAKGEPQYSGNLATTQFNLGKFIGDTALGNVLFKGKFEGSSFDINTLKANLDGHFDRFEYNGYAYSNIDVNGIFQKKYFAGELKVNDSSASLLSNVNINLNGDKPSYNVLGDVTTLDMQKTGFVKKPMVVTGLFDLDFTGKNIDDFVGTAKVLNVSITRDTSVLNFDSLVVNASVDSNKFKVLSVTNNQFDATIRGEYSILDLPTTFQSFLSNYYPAVFKKPANVPKNQHFTMTMNTYDFDKYANIIDNNLHGLDSMIVQGAIDTKDSGNFYVNASVPFAKYKKFQLQNALLEGRGNFSKVNVETKVNKAYINDSTYFPNTNLVIASQNNHSQILLSTSSNNAINEINLAADVYNLEDGVKINFRPSYFVVNDKKWNLESEGELVIRKNYASARNVKFTQGFQEISLETRQSTRDTSHNNLIVKLSQVNIGDFTSMFLPSPRLEGLANGQVVMINFYGDFSISDSLRFDQFRFNNDSIGMITTRGFYSGRTKNIRFTVNSENKDYDFNANGNYSLNDSVEVPMNIVINMKKTRVNLLDAYLNTLFSSVDGYGAGRIEIKGKPDNYSLLGSATLSGASLSVIYTRVKYFVDSARFNFTDSSIAFGNFVIKDKYGNKGNVSGTLYHRSFNNMKFDFNVKSSKILAIDTKASDNSMFYGKAIAGAEFVLKGTQDNMLMNISAEPADTSLINIVTTSMTESSTANFIIFKKYGRAIKDTAVQNVKIDLTLNLRANNKATINVILDPLTGDVITAKGNGTLNIHVPPTGNMTMNGKFNIERGKYDFSFQSLVKRPFEFLDGANNYIEWTGDPMNANIHVDAQYTAQQVSLSQLINDQSNAQGTSLNNVRGYRGDVYVIVQLRDKLMKPNISFQLDFPTGSSVKSDPDFALFLSHMESDQNEMLKQVAYLIAFNSFAPYGQTSSSGVSYAAAGLNTISSLLTSELNNWFSNQLTKLTGDRGLRFEIGATTYSSSDILGSGAQRLDRQSVNFKLMQSFANDKIIFIVGGNMDFATTPAQSAGAGSQFLPDMSVEFVLSRDRRLRAIVFSRSSLGTANSVTISRQNRYGASISYTKDFERFFAGKQKDYREIKLHNNTMTITKEE